MPLDTASVRVEAISRPPSGSASRSRARAWTLILITQMTAATPLHTTTPTSPTSEASHPTKSIRHPSYERPS